MPISVANKHLAGNSTFSAPSNPGWCGGRNDGATMYSCAGHALR